MKFCLVGILGLASGAYAQSTLTQSQILWHKGYLEGLHLDQLTEQELDTSYSYAKGDMNKVIKEAGLKEIYLGEKTGLCGHRYFSQLTKSQAGLDLIANCNKLRTFVAIKAQLNRCGVVSDDIKEALFTPILNGAAQTKASDMLKTKTCSCSVHRNSVVEMADNVDTISVTSLKQGMLDLTKGSVTLAYKNAADAYFSLSHRLPSNFSARTPDILQSLCQNCPQGSKDILSAELTKLDSDYQKSHDPPLEPSQVRAFINSYVDRLNHKAALVEAPISGGAPENNQALRTSYEVYMGRYNEELRAPLGILLTSATVQGEIGDPRLLHTQNWLSSSDFAKVNITDDTTGQVTPTYQLKPHGRFWGNDKMVKMAADDLLDRIQGETKQLGDIYSRSLQNQSDYSTIEKDFKAMLETNPVAVGQYLMKHPEYTKLVCSGAFMIMQDKQNRKDIQSVALAGGAIFAGTAMILAPEAAPLVALMGWGGAMTPTAVDMGYMVSDLKRVDQLQNALSSGNASSQAAVEAVEEYDRAAASLEVAAVSSVGALVVTKGLTKIFAAAAEANSLASVKKIASAAEEMSSDPQVLSTVNQIEEKGGEKATQKLLREVGSDPEKLTALGKLSREETENLAACLAY